MAQGNFGAAEDFDVMMVEPGGLQGESGSNMVQVQTVASEMVGNSDSLAPQHAEADGSEDGQRARFHLPPHDSKDGFQVSDLVWAELEGHPWWPGEIFDPSDASELALKHQLLPFFGDSSFAWCDESQLKPFLENCSQMMKQGNSDAFTSAVNFMLQELSRRILSATSCSLLMSYMVDNCGIKAGVTCSTVNKAEMLKSFSPESLLHYVQSLALSPGQGSDLHDLVIVCSQLMSFYRSKWCPEIASFQSGSGWGENGIDCLSTKNVMLGEAVTNEVQPNQVKSKRGRGRPRKQKPEANLELMEKEPTALLLTFGRSTDLPSERDLIKMFSRSGPLKENETEVHRNTNTVKVVFKKRVDAERAFSVAGKFGTFGPSLRTFRLVEMPCSLGTTELNKLCPEDSDLKIPALRFYGVSLDSTQVDIIDKGDKSVEHVEMVKQAEGSCC